MTTYDLTNLEATRTGFVTVQTHLNNMLTGYLINTQTPSTTTSTSTAYVTLLTEQLTGIATSDLIKVRAIVNVSGDTTGMRLLLRLTIGGTAGLETYYTELSGNTLGRSGPVALETIQTGKSGTVDVDLDWRIQFQNGGTNMYTDRYQMAIEVNKHGVNL